jgi:hypothetical protein
MGIFRKRPAPHLHAVEFRQPKPLAIGCSRLCYCAIGVGAGNRRMASKPKKLRNKLGQFVSAATSSAAAPNLFLWGVGGLALSIIIGVPVAQVRTHAGGRRRLSSWA